MFEKLAEDILNSATEKLANRARELMRMGRLSGEAIRTLKDRGMLPSTRIVTRGIERGSDALSLRHNIRNGVNITKDDRYDWADSLLARAGMSKSHSAYNAMRDELADALWPASAANDAYISNVMAQLGSGSAMYTNLPNSSVDRIQNIMPSHVRQKAKKIMIDNPDYRDAMAALIKRHEINEGLKILSKEKELLSKYITPQKARKGLNIVGKSSSTAHGGVEVLSKEIMDGNQLFGTDFKDMPLAVYRRPRITENGYTRNEYRTPRNLMRGTTTPRDFLRRSKQWDSDDLANIVKNEGIDSIVASPLEFVKDVLS